MAAETNTQTINLSKIECIPPKLTIATLNQFIMNSVDFINRFAYFSEEKLLALDENIDKLETQLILLEKKLDTIPSEYFANIPQTISQPQPQPTQQQPSTPIPTPPQTTVNSNAPPPPALNLPPPPPPPPGPGPISSSGGPPPPPPPPLSLLLANKGSPNKVNLIIIYFNFVKLNLPPPPPPPPVQGSSSQNDGQNQNSIPPTPQIQGSSGNPVDNQPPVEEQKNELPEPYKKYKKLYEMGVPYAAYKVKMLAEALDPAVFETYIDVTQPFRR